MKKYLFVLFALCSIAASAQQFYDHTPNARIAAMGGAAVATKGDAFAVFGNAASALLEYKIVQASFSYTDFSGEQYRKNRMLSAGAYARFAQRHALLVGMQFNMEPRVEAINRRPGAQRFDLAYGYKINNRMAVAATLRYRYTYGNLLSVDNINGAGGDLSIFSRLPVTFMEGATINIGGKLSFDAPSSVDYDRYTFSPSVGAALSLPFSDAHLLDISAELRYGAAKKSNLFAAKIGAEYSLMRLFYFRAGANVAQITNCCTLNYGTIGAGIRFFHLQADIAYIIGRKSSPFNNAIQVNFGLDF